MEKWKNRLFGSLSHSKSLGNTSKPSGGLQRLKSSVYLNTIQLKEKSKGYKSPIMKAKDNFDDFYKSIVVKPIARPSDFNQVFMEDSLDLPELYPIGHLCKLKETIETADVQHLSSDYREILKDLASTILQTIEQENFNEL